MQAVLDDWTTADVPERTRAALRLLEAMTLRPLEIDTAFVDDLRADGLDDESIREAANVGFHYNLINRVADAFDFPIPKAEAKAKLAKMLDVAGKLLKGVRSDRLWDRDDEAGRTRPAEVHVGRERMLCVEATTAPELRSAVEGFVLAEWGHAPAGEAPPQELHAYLRKLGATPSRSPTRTSTPCARPGTTTTRCGRSPWSARSPPPSWDSSACTAPCTAESRRLRRSVVQANEARGAGVRRGARPRRGPRAQRSLDWARCRVRSGARSSSARDFLG